MKGKALIAALGAATTASGLIVGEQVEQVMMAQQQPVINNKFGKWAAEADTLLNMLAESVGETLGEIPQEARAIWSDIVSSQSLKDIRQAAFNTVSELRKQQFTPKDDFLRVKSHKDVVAQDDWSFTVQDASQEYTLRGKESDPDSLHLDTGKTYTGYIDFNDDKDHLFYWFFPSRNDPKNDPVVLWMNGGPGCSSATGLFFELGPSFINNQSEPYLNPNSWNSNASVIFLDQPIGVGYSYESAESKSHHDKRDKPSSTRSAAKHVYSFLKLFFTQFEEFAELPFHIFSESYGGHYGPAFASEIVRRQPESEGFDGPHINLASLGVGNGIFDTYNQIPAYYDMACTNKGGVEPVLGEEDCEKILAAQPRCQSMVKACYDLDSAWVCAPASYFCDQALSAYGKTGLNPYDIRMNCTGNPLCYDELTWVDNFLNDPEIQQAVGAEPVEFESCSQEVGIRFFFTGDGARPFHHDVAYLLNNDIPVLVYAGDKDFICNWLGNQAWVQALDGYTIDGKDGKEQFDEAPVVDWKVGGNHAGTLQNVGHFTFLRVFDAGHMVPYNKGPEALSMLNAWLSGDYALKST